MNSDIVQARLDRGYQTEIAVLKAQRDTYFMALKRLASSEAFHVACSDIDPELLMRMEYADTITKGR